jgi:hypothetical protein
VEASLARKLAMLKVETVRLSVSSGAMPGIILEGPIIDIETAAWYSAATKIAGRRKRQLLKANKARTKPRGVKIEKALSRVASLKR